MSEGRWFKKVNESRNQKRMKKILEDNGHHNVEVWWEPVRGGAEMCGPEGGFFFSSDEYPIEPLGYSFEEAMQCIEAFYLLEE